MPVPPRSRPATPPHQPGRRPAPQLESELDDWPVDRGRPLGLRLLALIGAFAFVMLGLSVIAPLLWPQPQTPPALRGGGTTT